jgi:hypothetical protein
MQHTQAIQNLLHASSPPLAKTSVRVERERERERERELSQSAEYFYFNPNLLNPFAHPHRKATNSHWQNLVVKDVPP